MLVAAGAEVAEGATIGPRVVLGPGCRVEAGARDPRLGPARRLRGRRGGEGQWLDPLRRRRGGGGRSLEGAVVGAGRKSPRLMLDDVLAIPEHLRDALWRVESARLEAAEAAG